MKNTLIFTVAVSFEDKITDDNEIKEVAENIARAIERETNGIGIAPENSETFTREVEVSNSFSEVNVRKTII